MSRMACGRKGTGVKPSCPKHGVYVPYDKPCPTCEKERNYASLLAVDPGVSGGVAWVDGANVVRAVKMPEGMAAQVDLLRQLTTSSKLQKGFAAWVEKVGFHVQGNNASASAKFARHCGTLEGALYALGVPVRQVAPSRWMSKFGKMPKDKKARKHAIRDEVQRRHPHLKVTLSTADALGILEWARGLYPYNRDEEDM